MDRLGIEAQTPARAIEDKIGRIDFPFSQFLGIESRVVLVGEGCRGISPAYQVSRR
jgi:hypothetical protein